MNNISVREYFAGQALPEAMRQIATINAKRQIPPSAEEMTKQIMQLTLHLADSLIAALNGDGNVGPL